MTKPNNIFIYREIITLESGKRSGKPYIRGMRITVSDILQWLSYGKSIPEIIEDFPELTAQDIFVALEFAEKQKLS
ncbi:MAG: DUF433 domain-containing protein [Bacteroidetes bacterium]|nr:MAG: DUF433 domain-containing protein [Bacteroidota bacterium]